MHSPNELLLHARTRLGLTGHEMAVKVGIAESRISKLENGATVTKQTMQRYIDAGVVSVVEARDSFFRAVA